MRYRILKNCLENTRKFCKCEKDRWPRWSHNGRFWRKSDSRWVHRFRCRKCNATFSEATLHPCYRQKKRKANHKILLLYSSSMSLRRIAKNENLNRKTVATKFRFIADKVCTPENELDLRRHYSKNPVKSLQADEMIDKVVSKLLPVSIALAVSKQDRFILGGKVSPTLAGGTLAALSRKKYGPRKDCSLEGFKQLLVKIRPYVSPNALLTTDAKPSYGNAIKAILPQVRHESVEGDRGCIVGQGELKKIKFDPLFCLNHTCAMIRGSMSRLARKTWCVSKLIENLERHLAIYIFFHNRFLIGGQKL